MEKMRSLSRRRAKLKERQRQKVKVGSGMEGNVGLAMVTSIRSSQSPAQLRKQHANSKNLLSKEKAMKEVSQILLGGVMKL